MAGELTTEGLRNLVSAVTAQAERSQGVPSDELLSAVNTVSRTAQAELDLDRGALNSARQRFESRYSPFIASAWNPVNWVSTTDARREASRSVWPLEPEIEADARQVERIQSVQQALVRRVLAAEQAPLERMVRELDADYSKGQAAALAGVCAATGMSTSDARALVNELKRLDYSTDQAVQLGSTLARLNHAYAEAGSSTRISVASLHATTQTIYKNWDGGADSTMSLVETYFTRLQTAQLARGTEPSQAERAQTLAAVKADFDALYELKGVEHGTAAILASLVGSPTPSRASVAQHYDWFYAQSGVSGTEAAVMTALVAPFDALDSRPADQRRQEIMADRKHVEGLRAPNGDSIRSADELSVLAAYRDPGFDFSTYMFLYMYFNNLYGSAAGSLSASASARYQARDVDSRVTRASNYRAPVSPAMAARRSEAAAQRASTASASRPSSGTGLPPAAGRPPFPAAAATLAATTSTAARTAALAANTNANRAATLAASAAATQAANAAATRAATQAANAAATRAATAAATRVATATATRAATTSAASVKVGR